MAIDEPTFQLFVLNPFVQFSHKALYAVVLSVGNEVGEVNWLLAMRLRSRNQPQSRRHVHTDRRGV